MIRTNPYKRESNIDSLFQDQKWVPKISSRKYNPKLR